MLVEVQETKMNSCADQNALEGSGAIPAGVPLYQYLRNLLQKISVKERQELFQQMDGEVLKKLVTIYPEIEAELANARVDLEPISINSEQPLIEAKDYRFVQFGGTSEQIKSLCDRNKGEVINASSIEIDIKDDYSFDFVHRLKNFYNVRKLSVTAECVKDILSLAESTVTALIEAKVLRKNQTRTFIENSVCESINAIVQFETGGIQLRITSCQLNEIIVRDLALILSNRYPGKIRSYQWVKALSNTLEIGIQL